MTDTLKMVTLQCTVANSRFSSCRLYNNTNGQGTHNQGLFFNRTIVNH